MLAAADWYQNCGIVHCDSNLNNAEGIMRMAVASSAVSIGNIAQLHLRLGRHISSEGAVRKGSLQGGEPRLRRRVQSSLVLTQGTCMPCCCNHLYVICGRYFREETSPMMRCTHDLERIAMHSHGHLRWRQHDGRRTGLNTSQPSKRVQSAATESASTSTCGTGYRARAWSCCGVTCGC